MNCLKVNIEELCHKFTIKSINSYPENVPKKILIKIFDQKEILNQKNSKSKTNTFLSI